MTRVVIGVGRPDRGDDAAGAAVVGRLPPRIPTIVARGDPAELIGILEGADEAIIVDAVVSGRPPGSVVVLDAARDALPVVRTGSTHGVGLAEAIELARALGVLPDRILVVGIECRDLARGAGISAAVRRAIPAVARLVERLWDEPESTPSTLHAAVLAHPTAT